MKSLMKKVRGNKKGFTLAELLVVVAIIGILVAISIPVFTAQLSKARKATNNANMRAAKAAAIAEFLGENATRKEGTVSPYKYTVSSGKVEKANAPTTTAVEINSDAVRGDALYTEIIVTITAENNGDETVTLYPTPQTKSE